MSGSSGGTVVLPFRPDYTEESRDGSWEWGKSNGPQIHVIYREEIEYVEVST